MSGLPFALDVAVSEPGWAEVFASPENDVARAVAAGLSMLDASPPEITKMGELSVALISDREIAALNRQYRDREGPTNVLSFPSTQPEHVQGDIVIALQTVLRECHRTGRSPRDHATHLLVHGFLHLHGYDHSEKADAKVMEDLERRALATLGQSDPYLLDTT